ncbi:MAG: hypothetical protein PHE79_01975 [Eubacteriales bacterium]|nr:hypothetical protein [Eubacteriales bacterium]
MAKIYCNKEFNGISVTVNFINGVGVSDDPYLISWFTENGYTVEEEKREPSEYDSLSYKELTERAKERGFNAIGVKKEQLIVELIKLDEGAATGLCETKNSEQKSEEAEE